MAQRPLVLTAAGSAVALASTILPSAPTAAETAVDPLDAALDQALAAHPAPVGSLDSVSIDPSDGTTTVELAGGALAQIDLPFADTEPATASIDAHSATFRHEESDTTAIVQPLVTNGVRMILTMGSEDSPTRYEFDLGDSSELVELSLAPNGGVQVSDTSDGDLGFIDPPWAMDADGNTVPTRYEIEGNRLVQIVEHHGAAYPVVADPSFQGDCGYLTCTLRFNRAETYKARNVSTLVGGLSVMCGVFGAPIGMVCVGAVAPIAALIHVAATEYYDDGDCLKIKFNKIPNPMVPGWPQRLDHGTYNCTDK